MLLRTTLLGLLFACCLLPTHAQPLVLNDPNQSYSLFGRFTALEVRPGQVTIDSLLQHPQAYRFTPVARQGLTVGHSYWLRLELTNQTPQLFALRIFLLSFNRMILYETEGGRILNQRDLALLVTDTTDYFQHSKRMWPLHLAQGQTHTIYLYVEGIWAATLPVYAQANLLLLKESHYDDLFYGFYYGFVLIVIVYSLLLFVRLGDRDNFLYAIWVFLAGLGVSFGSGQGVELSSHLHNLQFTFTLVSSTLLALAHILFQLSFLPLRQVAVGWYRAGFWFAGFCALLLPAYPLLIVLGLREISNSVFTSLLSLAYQLFGLSVGIVAYRRGFRPAIYMVVGTIVLFTSLTVYLMLLADKLPFNFWTLNSLAIGSGLEILIFTLAMGDKVNLLKRHQEEANQEQLRLTKENQQLIENQNRVLEEKVEQRTAELRASQAQLIQKEKLASLGELTAGIAHEIQNPLNFVTNFAEVSVEMIDELKEKISTGRSSDVLPLADYLSENLQTITEQGQRAAAIIRSMLEHAGTPAGEKQPTDMNALADAYLQLAYYGIRAKDQGFTADLRLNLDPALQPITVTPQDMGRVLLNLYNNAFYATQEKARRQQDSAYQPQIEVTTQVVNGKVSLRVADNGTGIPAEILSKIYQPFFTTKPTGEGTGLGLSLSYDIITKGHGGTMEVESQEGEGAEFVIALPC
ncbi:hypothetical protein GCM10023187_00950 [Nibrella viscosa]|uniref:histidine kinase n=1 Tax=Nibrella viscosa TaxID=1084524 RepID=A0ABP8JR22_9BACT